MIPCLEEHTKFVSWISSDSLYSERLWRTKILDIRFFLLKLQLSCKLADRASVMITPRPPGRMRRFVTMQKKTCYLCTTWIREDQIMVTRIPIWATATASDPERWKNTDVAMAFINDEGEIVTLCMNCALDATMRCWKRIQTL